MRISVIPDCLLGEMRLVGNGTYVGENVIYSIPKRVRICMHTKKVRVPLTGIWGYYPMTAKGTIPYTERWTNESLQPTCVSPL